jgi:hypothetical protein
LAGKHQNRQLQKSDLTLQSQFFGQRLYCIIIAMSGSEKQKNRNSSQMRNRALPANDQQPAHNQFTPSLEPIPGPGRDRSAKSQNKQQSKVMLGMPDVPIDEDFDNDAYATKIGGKPVCIQV